MKLTTHFPPGPRLRMHGAIPLLPLQAFMVWAVGKNRILSSHVFIPLIILEEIRQMELIAGDYYTSQQKDAAITLATKVATNICMCPYKRPVTFVRF
jgi:hypothetical protein